MSALNAFLDKQGLTHYDSKLKTVAAGQMTIEGRTITLKSVSGATLATVTMPQTIYELATAQKDGLMSMGDFAKLQGIAAQATKVENSETNGNIQINDVETPVYVHPTVTAGALGAGLYKITTDGNGHVTLGTKVVKGDITALGIPAQDTTYGPATADAAGLMSAADFTKLQGVAVGAQVNVIEKVSVNGGALPVSSKGVNIDLTPYALKTDIASAVIQGFRRKLCGVADQGCEGRRYVQRRDCRFCSSDRRRDECRLEWRELGPDGSDDHDDWHYERRDRRPLCIRGRSDG